MLQQEEESEDITQEIGQEELSDTIETEDQNMVTGDTDEHMRCQFCGYGWWKGDSIYKRLIHIYLGHQRLVSKLMKQNEVKLTCLGRCSFVGANVEDCGLSAALGELEDHMLEEHPGEKKLLSCNYCQTVLGNEHYWEHCGVHCEDPGPLAPQKKVEEQDDLGFGLFD